MAIALHVGLPKTGTTALQNWLSANSLALAAEGIFVLPPVFHAHRLAVEALRDDKRVKERDIVRIKELSFEEARESLLRGMSAANLRCAVVSSEYFSLAAAGDVASLFRNLGTQVSKIVCFVRRQDDLLASGYNQDIKGLGRSAPWTTPPYRRIYDFLAMREDWKEAFPEAQVVLHNFDHLRNQGTLIDVFARDIGALSTYSVPPKSNTNESLSAELLEIVRVANGCNLPQIGELAVAAQEAGLKGTHFSLAESIRREILEQYAESNARIIADDVEGEFAGFGEVCSEGCSGADLTGVFPVEFALKLMAWAIRQQERRSESVIQ